MAARRVLLALLLLALPTAGAAQMREPSPFPAAAPPLFAERPTPPPTPRLERIPTVVRYAAAGALAGAALGYGAYLIQEHTVEHSDHEMDPLVRFGSMSVGALLGAVAGTLVHAARTP